MKNSFAFATSMLLLAFSHCFGQAGSPDQAAFNQAVMKYRETVETELAKVIAATSGSDGKSDSNPIRANMAGGDAARQSANAVSSSAASVQARASRLGTDEWFAVVVSVKDTEPQKAQFPGVKFPARYSIQLVWCPTNDFETAIAAAKKLIEEKTHQLGSDDNLNLVSISLWIDDSNKSLLNSAANINPGDCVLFTSENPAGKELRVVRIRETREDPERKLFAAANLDRKEMFGVLNPAAFIEVGKRMLYLQGFPWTGKADKDNVESMWDGMHLKSIRVLAKSEAMKRSSGAEDVARMIDRHVFAKDVRQGISSMHMQPGEIVNTWLDTIDDSSERLLREVEAHVFENRDSGQRGGVTVTAARKAVESAPETLKARVLLALSVAELRAGRHEEAMAALKRVSKAKRSDDEKLMEEIVKCLVQLAAGDHDAAAKEGTAIRDRLSSDMTVSDYRALALLAEVQSAIGIEAGKGDPEFEIKFNWGPAKESGK